MIENLAIIVPYCHIVLWITGTTFGLLFAWWFGKPKGWKQYLALSSLVVISAIAAGWTWWDAFGAYIQAFMGQ